MEKKDILFLCQFSYPETVSSATLPFDTAEYLAQQGYSVDVLCGYPKEYSAGQKVPKQETVNGVNITRLKYMQLSRKSSIGRLVNYFSFTLKARMNVKRLKKYKVVIVYSNPPVLPTVSIKAKKKYGTKFIFVAYDLYPEIAYASGSIGRGGFLDKLMKKINNKLYSSADAVVSLTDEMKDFILKNRQGIDASRIHTIENWAHEKKRIEPDAESYEKFGFSPNQLVVSYFGNMGTCQDIDTLLDAAEAMKDDSSIGFLIVGHGNKKERVISRVAERGLTNVKTYDYLVGDDFERAVSISGCFVVSLEKGLKGMCAPSKYYSYLLGAQPVVAITEDGSYLAKEIIGERIGGYVRNGDVNALCELLRSFRDNPDELRAMGERARQLYDRAYSKTVAMSKYDEMLKDILKDEEQKDD